MATIQRFEDLEAWQLARKLTARIYELTNRSPFSQDWGLRNQIRDASGSAMHNAAEGFDAGSDTEFIRFLRYARRSTSEVQSELYIAFDQEYITAAEFHETYNLAKQTKQKINGLLGYLKQAQSAKRRPHPPTAPTTTRPHD